MTTTIVERKIVEAAKLHTVVYAVDGAIKANMLVDSSIRVPGGDPVTVNNYTNTKDLSDANLITWINANL